MEFKTNNAKSIVHSSNAELMRYARARGIIGVGVNNAAPMITTPNINVIAGALQYIRPGAIKTLTAPRVSDKIARAEKNGKWGDRAIVIKTKEFTGKTSPDDGMTSDGLQVKTNYNYVTRGAYYYTTGWLATDLQEATTDGIQENYRADQANGAMETLAIDRNKFFFNGVATASNDLPIYGFLNEPSLTAYATVKQNVGGTSTYWADKTPEEIYNDIVDAINQLYIQSNGVVEDQLENGKIKIAVASGSWGNVDRANSFGLTARAKLKETYGDKVEIVAVPQLNSADSNSDCFYVIFDMEGEHSTLINSYIEMARAYPLFTKDSVVSQKISAATSGCVVQYPWAIVRRNGIGATTRQ
ncbi:MAG: DUF2184 domain-containing protein [Bacteroidales bacterium]|nr:DUF2184 domain-containing protein [Bacteroidales bacterium]